MKRYAKWDNLKFILIYFVVLGHLTASIKSGSSFLKGMQLFLYTFHMPAFFLISGLFSKRTIDEKKYDRIVPYFILYVFMKVFRFLVYSFISGKSSGFDLLSEEGVPWFALTLFLFYFVMMQLSAFRKDYIMIVTVCLGMMAGYDTRLGGFLTGMRFFTFLPVFALGYCLPVEKVTEFTDQKKVKMISAIIMLMVLMLCFSRQRELYGFLTFLKGKASYEQMKMLPYGGIYRGLYYILTIIISFCIISLAPSEKTVFTGMGQRTIQVFALHFPVIRVLMDVIGLKNILIRIWPSHYGVLVPLVGLVLTIVLSWVIFEPFFNWLMHPQKKMIRNERKG